MSLEERLKDQEFVMHLREMARVYDSDFLRRVADRFCELSEEKYNERHERYDHANSEQ